MAKDYVEILNDGSGDRYVRDAEAQAGIAQVASAIGIDYEFVDLRLPSGTLWAKCNVGATVETGYGNYYMYGKGSRQYNSSDDAYSGTENPLDSDADTATQVIGSDWHTPTKTQFDELIANTTYTWEEDFNGSGINGGKFTATNGNYVFFPATGFKNSSGSQNVGRIGIYWSNTPITDRSRAASFYVLSNASSTSSEYRVTGCSVRGVMDSSPYDVTKKADKSTTYTKAEVDAMKGPVYDEDNRSVVFPSTSATRYDSASRSVVVAI